MNTHLLRASGLLVFVGVAACGDTTPVTPPLRPSVSPSFSAAVSRGKDEQVTVSRRLARLNSKLAATGRDVRILKAELLMNGNTWNGATSTLIFANDRHKGIGAEWVPGDPRRGDRAGVTYAIATRRHVQPFTLDPAPFNIFKLVSHEQLAARIDEGMAAWRDLSCSSRPIAFSRHVLPTDKDPDMTDQLIFEQEISADYEPAGDIVHSGWRHLDFFNQLADFFELPPGSGASILGITLTYFFVDDKGTETEDDDTLTDIDRNKKADIGVAEIFYNTGFNPGPPATAYVWSNSGALAPFLDFYSIIAHESGHALGLSHFGKVFVTKKDAEDGGGISLSEVKYAPYALMNAVYVAGRNELATMDRTMFCQQWRD